MVKMLIGCLVLILLLLSPQTRAIAASQLFQLELGTVRFDIPDDWQSAPGLYGMPLMLLGPVKEDRRPTISVTPLGEAPEFDLEPRKDEKRYKKGREEWLKEMGGRSLSYNPFQKIKWPGMSEGFTMGYRYEINGIKYSENTYYVICKGNLYHLKTLLDFDQEKEYSPAVNKLLRSFSCE